MIAETHRLVNVYLALPHYLKHDEFVAQVNAAAHRPLGAYQQAFLAGHYAPSGADLRGVARKHSGDYAHSRETVLKLITVAGFDVAIRPEKGLTGRKYNILIITRRPDNA